MDPMTPAHVLESALYVDDLDAAVAFYASVFSLPLVGRVPGRHAFLRCGPGMLLLFVAAATEVPGPPGPLQVPPHGARGPGHLAFAAEPHGIEAWAARLQALGIPVEKALAWPGGARSLYLRDPSGNSVEIAEARLWAGGA